MPYTALPMVPGPVSVPDDILTAMTRDYGSGQIETDFLKLYHTTGRNLAKIMGTQHDVVLMTGEGMLALWSGLKSCLRPGQRVLSLATGVFGDGIGHMAASMGCEVRWISYGFDESIHDFDRIADVVRDFKPHMITAVHCETPSGTFNPIAEIGAIKRHYQVPLLYVDAVASLGGAPVEMDAWHVDLLLGGSQKCLSAPPSMSILGVSPAAWEIARRIQYQGYDALSPWQSVQADGRCPYTPYWHGVAALHAATERIFAEGLGAVFSRHEQAAAACHKGLADAGIALWNTPESLSASTVTAARIPEGLDWPTWREALRQQGLVVAGSFGPMAGKVFRLGHMGTQADLQLIQQACHVINYTKKQLLPAKS
ncbi:MAG: aminotransferase class V-fold PLP-dependent enzyme [Desulfovibrionaceae bacterium]